MDTSSHAMSRVDLIKRIEAIAEGRRTASPGPAVHPSARLPTWHESRRGIPNGLLRSALFGAISHDERRYMNKERVTALDGIEIFYTGMQLDQGDLNVWATVLHFARGNDLREPCRFTAHAMLMLLRKSDGGPNYGVLEARFERLRANAIIVRQSGRKVYVGGLIDRAYRDEVSGEYVVELDPLLAKLFERDQFTQVDWLVRQVLAGKQLALWLHGFYATHAKPYPYKVETLHQLCRSKAQPSSFRNTLRLALKALEQACSECGELFRFELSRGLVHVERRPTASQQRHLISKASGYLKAGKTRGAS